MRRAAFFLFFSLASLSCGADRLTVTTDRVARVYYYTQAKPEPIWEEGPASERHELNVKTFESRQVGAVDDRDWFILWRAEVTAAANEGVISLRLRPQLRWGRITPLLILLSLAVLGVIPRVLRRQRGSQDSRNLTKAEKTQEIAGYPLLELLGRGGHGEVYRSRDVNGLPVAIKVLRLDLGGDSAAEKRFAREIKVLCGLNLPGVVQVYDWGYEDGKAYLVLELLEGESLGERVRSGALQTPQQVSEVFLRVAEALDGLHAQGLVHRDIKPENVFLLKDGRVKVLDFGTALRDDLTRATQGVVGTPSYMSPEQIQGRLHPATDQYALGIVLFKTLTGASPYQAEDLAGLAYAHVHTRPLPASKFNQSLGIEVDRVFCRMLEKLPESRYPSCKQAVEALLSAWSLEAPVSDETSDFKL